MTQVTIIRAGALLMALAVGLGAFGAHALRERVSAEHLEVWRTAVQYQLVHAIGLLAIAGLWGWLDPGRGAWAVRLLMVGTLIFSGTLYALVLSGVRVLGAVTPLGGLAMIAGWLVLASAAVRIES